MRVTSLTLTRSQFLRQRRFFAVLVALALGTLAIAAAIQASNTGPPPGFTLSPAKLNAWNNDQPGNQTGAPPARKNPNQAPPVSGPPVPPAHAGEIVPVNDQTGVQVPAPSSVFQATTAWLDDRNGVFVNVYAGSLASDPDQGALIAWVTNDVTGAVLAPPTPLETPKKIGALTITGVRGDTVSFSAPGGGGTFDLGNRTFTITG